MTSDAQRDENESGYVGPTMADYDPDRAAREPSIPVVPMAEMGVKPGSIRMGPNTLLNNGEQAQDIRGRAMIAAATFAAGDTSYDWDENDTAELAGRFAEWIGSGVLPERAPRPCVSIPCPPFQEARLDLAPCPVTGQPTSFSFIGECQSCGGRMNDDEHASPLADADV